MLRRKGRFTESEMQEATCAKAVQTNKRKFIDIFQSIQILQRKNTGFGF